MQSNGLKYASRLPIGYWLHNLLSSPARQYPTANLATLGQVLPPTFEAERHRSRGSFNFSMAKDESYNRPGPWIPSSTYSR